MPVRIEMDEYGPPEVLHPVTFDGYQPGPGEAVVRVAAAPVNRADCFIRAGAWPQGGGWPYVPGLELCGTVQAVGEGVTRVAPGDRVITMMQRLGGIHGERPGGYQEVACVPARALVHVPEDLDLALALAGQLGLPAVTAFEATRLLEVREGMRVLVTGAASSVGIVAMQHLADLGCEVVATTRSADKAEILRGFGATEVCVTGGGDWAQGLDGVQRVFDLLGRDTFAAAVGLLEGGGRLVFVGGTSGGDVCFSAWELMRPVTLTGYSSEHLSPADLAAAMDAMAEAVRREVLRPPPVQELPLGDAARAHEILEASRTVGRVVLVPERA